MGTHDPGGVPSSTATSGSATSPCSAATGRRSASPALTAAALGRPGRRQRRGRRADARRHVHRAGPRRTTGRVFISKNVDADPAGAVTWTRLDTLAANDPNRFVTGIYDRPGERRTTRGSRTAASTSTTPGHPGARLRGDLRPWDRDRDVGRSSATTSATCRSPTSRRDRRDRRPLRVERLRRAAPRRRRRRAGPPRRRACRTSRCRG